MAACRAQTALRLTSQRCQPYYRANRVRRWMLIDRALWSEPEQCDQQIRTIQQDLALDAVAARSG
jgi:TfoX/Sxy family transcriptional regulator of competence genes